jgi:hypothetical protein
MGYRDDDIVDQDRADAALRRALERLQALEAAPPPPDLVTKTARRLPAVPPAIAARQLARRALLGAALRLGAVVALALVLLLGVASVLGIGGRLALLFGDGGVGLSRALLTVQLLAKPLWHSLGMGGALPVAVAAAVGAGWLWWWTLRLTPIYSTENAP